MSAQLVADVASLQELVDGLDRLQPYDLANGAVGLLDEAACGKITGEEERYSHIDLLDMAANVEGSEQAFAYLEEGLATIDPDLVATIKERFDALDAAVAAARRSRATERASCSTTTLTEPSSHRPVRCAPGRRRAAVAGSAKVITA